MTTRFGDYAASEPGSLSPRLESRNNVALLAKGINPSARFPMQQREILFSGRVQGVGFRYTTRSLATGFEVAGFVRNLPDGRVQLVLEGDDDEMNRFLVALRKEMGQYIFDQTETVRPASGKITGFEVRF
jgi:acylphosphatase